MALAVSSQESPALPLSQDMDVFISTQVQSRYDDFEAEQESLKMAQKLREKFKHTADRLDASKKRDLTDAVRHGPRPKPDLCATADKPKRTKMSNAEPEQLMRLSGHPVKARKMRKHDPKLRPLSEALFGKGSSCEEVKVFSGKEWSKVSSTLTTHLKRAKQQETSADSQDKNPWWFGDEEPSELEMPELNLLYEETDLPPSQSIKGSGELQDEPPITLSQVLKPLYQAVPSPEVIEISDESEVECSEDEGDLILLDNQPICISSQEPLTKEESQDKLHSQVTVTRIKVRTEPSSRVEKALSEVLSTQILDEPAVSDDEINDSLDEDLVTRTLLIKRKTRII